MTTPIARLIKGTRTLDLQSGRYGLRTDFNPPPYLAAPLFAEGTSANRNGAIKVDETPVNRTFKFTVNITGNSNAEIRRGIADTKLKIEDLNTKKYLTPEQKAELDSLNQTLKDQQTAYDENATAHEKATARIVFGFVQQQMAADGLSADEILALADIGKAWGIYDQKTADTLKAVTLSVQKHGADSKAILEDLDKAVTDLPNYKDFTYNIIVNGTVPYGAEPPGGVGGSGNAYSSGGGNGSYGGAQAAGGDYWVTSPTWFLAGEAGPERATFTPQGQTTNMGGITINVNGASDPRAVAQEVSRIIAAQTRAVLQSGKR